MAKLRHKIFATKSQNVVIQYSQNVVKSVITIYQVGGGGGGGGGCRDE